MDFEIRQVSSDDEFNKVTQHLSYAFRESPSDLTEFKEWREYYKESYEVILYKDGEPAATAASIPMTQNIRGQILDMSGVAGVSTYPKYRRKGYVKALMQHLFKDMNKKQQAVSSLYPFRESFYGKFGYITFPQDRIAKVDPSKLKNLLDYDLDITYTRTELKDRVPTFIEFVNKIQGINHGFAVFPQKIHRSIEKREWWLLTVEHNSKIIAAMTYTNEGFEKPMKVKKFLYQNSLGKYGLLRFLALHTDQVSTISIPLDPTEQPENWVFDLDVQISSKEVVPSAMGRVIHVSMLDGINVGTGIVIISLKDEYCPWNSGNWRLTGKNGKLDVSETNQQGIELNAKGLAGLVFGSHKIEDMHIRGWIKPEDKRKQLQQLFPHIQPYLYERF